MSISNLPHQFRKIPLPVVVETSGVAVVPSPEVVVVSTIGADVIAVEVAAIGRVVSAEEGATA